MFNKNDNDMKTTMKILMVSLMVMLSIPVANAQTYEWQKPLQQNEKELDMVIDTFYAGNSNVGYTVLSIEQAYKRVLEKAKKQYGETYDFVLRNVRLVIEDTRHSDRYYYTSATIAIPAALKPVVSKPVENPLSKALDKALIDVRDGSRIAIDQIRVPTGMNKEDYKDEVVEVLLDKGFKVVAKEYLERLFEEQKSQQSGVYNEKTTVKEDNFSAVGYYLNVKLTETALRVQVINVSTGEYDGNVTIKLQ